MVDPQKPRRRSIRLKEFDYSQAGAYFVTVCTRDRTCLFGDVAASEMRLNEYGRIAFAAWEDLPNHYPNVELDAFVVMPNHVHGIIVLVGAGFKPARRTPEIVRAGLKPAPTNPASTRQHGLGEILRGFKTFSARRINQRRAVSAGPLWQRNYYEHVIRNEESLTQIREYILNNPAHWEFDRENPEMTHSNRPQADAEPWHV